MGTSISNLITYLLISIQEKKIDKATQTPTDIINTSLQVKIKSGKSKSESFVKNIRKDSDPIYKQNSVQTTHEIPYFSSADILQTISKIEKEHTEYSESWTKFQQAVKNYFTFKMMIPDQINDYGRELLKQGIFIYCWLKIVGKNPFINMNIIGKYVRDSLLMNVTHQKHVLEKYLDEISPIADQNILNNGQNGQQSLKRQSILKNSPKRVTFAPVPIIHHKLDFNSNNEIFIPQMPKAKAR